MRRSEAEALVARVESLSYPRRLAEVAAWALGASTEERDEVLAELIRGDLFRRGTALHAALVVGHQPTVLALVEDWDLRLRSRALKAAVADDPTTTREALADAPAQVRQAVYRMARTSGDPALADELVDAVRQRFGDREAATLLPGCGEQTVRRLLPELGHAVNRTTLARRHPAAALDHAEGELTGMDRTGRRDWWLWHGDGVLSAGTTLPHRVLDLLERFAQLDRMPGTLTRYGVLLGADPERTLALFVAPQRETWLRHAALPRAVLRRLGRLEPRTLTPLAVRYRGSDWQLKALLDALPPARRAELYDAATAGVDRTHAVLGAALLDVLPREYRIGEARRMLAIPHIADDEAEALRLKAYLPLDEARPELNEATRRTDADERATAYELLVGCAMRTGDPAAITVTLCGLTRLRNEQDPVRMRFLRAVRRIPPRLLQPELVPALTEFVADTTRARDASVASLDAIRDLAVTVVQHHVDSPQLVEWALEALRRLFGHRMPHLGQLDQRLRRGQERQLFTATRQWIEAGLARGEFEPLFAVARSLRHRAWLLPELQDLLRAVIRRGTPAAVFHTATTLWLADPRTRGERVEHVIDADRSAVTLPEVWNVLCANRVDLLGVALGRRAPRGRFVVDGVRWVPSDARHTERWPAQWRRSYTDLLAGLAADAGTAADHRIAAISAAATVPEFGAAVAHRYLDSANPAFAEAALAAIARTDLPAKALAELLRHADSDRAKVAVYAAGRTARFLPPSQLGALGDLALSTSKITSRKEALRLLVDLAMPGAADTVLAVWRRPDEHRDVRSAAVSAAHRLLDEPAGWLVLDEAAGGPDRGPALAAMPPRPLTIADRHHARYGALVQRLCTSTDTEVARAGWAAMSTWAAWSPDAASALAATIADLANVTGWRTPMRTLANLVDAGSGGPALLATVDALMDADRTAAELPGRDIPAWQRLHALVDTLEEWSVAAGLDADRTMLVDAARRMIPSDTHAGLGIALLLAGIPQRPASPELLDELADLLVERPAQAELIIAALHRLRSSWTTGWGHDELLRAADRISRSPRLGDGMIACGLALAGADLGWPPEWRAVIQRLRHDHPAPDVRTAARTWTFHPE